jgi:superfamily I DNA/RNA helicase
VQLTAQQQDFVKAITGTQRNVALVARAGCGKTSTILAATEAYSRIFPSDEITICAFGKAIQKEIEQKLKDRGLDDWRKYQASTTHSMGWNLVKFVFKSKIDDKKVWNLINARNLPVYTEYGAQVRELVHLAKTEGFGFFGDVQIGDVSAWYAMADHYGVNSLDDTSDMDAVIEAAQSVYRASLEQTDVVDFDDMILFPLIKNLRVRFQRDLIFLDEAQDTSRARRALVKKFVKPDGRIVVVGDDRQAIMGFAGASADALTDFIAELDAVILPLNVTWRCPKAVVAVAQTLVPDIQAADSAIEGEVTSMDQLPEQFNPTDAILCRNTAPLIENAYALIRKGVACKVEGREIGTGLLRLVDRWKRITTITAFLDKLEDFRAREIQKAQAKGHDNKVDEINDRCDTLEVICRACQQKGQHMLDAVRDFINDLFADDVTGVVTLCTYHRAKGREWPRVMLIEHSKRCPSPRAKQVWQRRQEANLAYVAITRAQQHLIFVG